MEEVGVSSMGEVKVKCVVWDLDNTLWDGTLAESDAVTLKKNIADIVMELDRRGILQSISSKNEYAIAIEKLRDFNLEQYFLYNQINWNSKADSIEKIATSFNFSLDTFAFIDDQKFERDDVAFHHPEVLCIDAAYVNNILSMSQFMPTYVTEDSKNRRLLYMNDISRNKKEVEFKGPKEDFLKTLQMKFTITKANEEDLKRVEELTLRTHQLNSTGTIYSFEELTDIIHSEQYMVLVAQLEDVYGTYGKIGLCVLELKEEIYIRLLLMSCRVISKGVGNVLMNYVQKVAKKQKKRILADFISTDRNRIMYITYKFNGFKEISNDANHIVLEADLDSEKTYPEYITVIEPDL